MKFNICAFIIYTILFEAIIWGIFGYGVFVKDRSGWWMLLALIISSNQLKPGDFNINKKEINKNGT